MPRPLRLTYEGATHHVYARGAARQAIFTEDRDHEHFLELAEVMAGLYRFRVYALVLMPNHFHMVFTTDDGELSALMQRWLTSYSTWFNRKHERSGHVFDSRFKSPIVDKDNYLLEVTRYAHLNPVRAELVKLPEQWKWSTFSHYLKPRNAPKWLDVDFLLSCFSGSSRRERALEHRAFVLDGIGMTEPPKVIDDLFIGGRGFAEKVKRMLGLATSNSDELPGDAVPLRRVISAVAERFQIAPELLTQPRNREAAEARQAVCYLARKHSDATFQQIAGALGAASHAVALRAYKAAVERAAADPQFGRLLKRAGEDVITGA
jgi:REP element-mobilizing transposase RayT